MSSRAQKTSKIVNVRVQGRYFTIFMRFYFELVHACNKIPKSRRPECRWCFARHVAEIEGPDPKKWLTGAMRLFKNIPTMYDTTGSDKNSQFQKLKPLKRAQMTSWWGIRPVRSKARYYYSCILVGILIRNLFILHVPDHVKVRICSIFYKVLEDTREL